MNINLQEYSFNEKINICKDNNGLFDGKFYLAVKSTKIFCLPSCRAKFPLFKNILFYDSCEKAIKNGFRPCKRCYPDKYPNNYPKWLDDIKKLIEDNYTRKITEIELIKLADVDITTIRRYFKKFFNTSLKEFQRQKKMNLALLLLQKGENLEKISDDFGYTSTKSFRTAFKNYYGFYPRDQDEFFRSGL